MQILNKWNRNYFSVYIPCIIAAIYLVLAITSVQYDDITFDESPHLRYGIQIIKGRTDRTIAGEERFGSTMPVSALNAVPRGIEQVMHPGIKKSDWGTADIKNGRYITILITLILLLYCFRFAASLTDDIAGCIVMFLIACDPNILAHSRLVTTDIYGTITFVATMYHLWKWLARKEGRHFYYWCIAIAIAQCCKPNNILLYPICLLPAIIYYIQKQPSLQSVVPKLFVFVCVQIIIINAFFLFSGPWGVALGDLPFKSIFFKNLQTRWVSKIPLPFPRAYIDTFDLVQYERETFKGTALNYLMGELRYKKGFWNYYLVCYALKTPLLSIAASLLGIGACFVKKSGKAGFIFCYWPCLLLLVFLSISSIQNGYRYLLPVNCLLLIFSGYFFLEALKIFPALSALCFSFLAVLTAINAFPNYLSYTNLLAGDKRMVYRFFADSNINWGQRQVFLQQFLLEHPGYVFEPPVPITGMIVVDVNKIAGIQEPAKFKWLRENYTPVATIESCYLVYDIKKLPVGY
jgi:Dolichyl-phosphate-mannose-protein mannosyltransferase